MLYFNTNYVIKRKKNYYTVRTVPKLNRNIAYKGTIDTRSTHIQIFNITWTIPSGNIIPRVFLNKKTCNFGFSLLQISPTDLPLSSIHGNIYDKKYIKQNEKCIFINPDSKVSQQLLSKKFNTYTIICVCVRVIQYSLFLIKP